MDNLKKVCNEVFGEENFVASFPRITKRAGKSTEAVAKNNDMLVLFLRQQVPASIYLSIQMKALNMKTNMLKNIKEIPKCGGIAEFITL